MSAKLLVVDVRHEKGPVYVCRTCRWSTDREMGETEAVRARTAEDRSAGLRCWRCDKAFTLLASEGRLDGEPVRAMRLRAREVRGRIQDVQDYRERLQRRRTAGYSWESTAAELRGALVALREAGPAPLPG